MNKKTWWVMGTIVALIVGAGAYVYFNNDRATDTNANSQSDEQKSPQQSSKSDNGVMLVAGRYIAYSADAVSAAKGDKLIFFHAPWCPQCRSLEEDIKASNLPSNLTIFKADYDTNQALRTRYGVTLQTTLIKIDDAGNKLKSYVAYDEPTFDAVKRELLP